MYQFNIYKLIDPRDNAVFYIGRTEDIDRRLSQHINEAKRYKDSAKSVAGEELIEVDNGNPDKVHTIIDIIDSELEPQIEVIDKFETNNIRNANRIEDAWIAHYRMLGCKLTNDIYSLRMNPRWYNPKRRGWKKGYARSPLEYIKQVKEGTTYKEQKSTFNT